ncbi:hypothetical protein MCOR27_002486 [Pyricularia oryzae]|uniref:Uncharacterized protein n=1 Tax=Pyricularia grisea TaxID=148305 RepID=A0ABQ8NSW3_PYRGI|nr:hypothetical protein MCOR01_007059 [Pyricularia oryzae]KAI6301677.1 hypothetical protein MCOR33_002813 [Pyricularia grisea]KAH9434366.1 hypothetical protein MCOR02_006377 [Pyricularia oryzae]KAI6258743.1 hypothetical protein MCOR19_004918 [Pyricularia oryzae]KAI6277719.1 hypothetical protein MCOR26_005006 [Pyricularia oryzae]
MSRHLPTNNDPPAPVTRQKLRSGERIPHLNTSGHPKQVKSSIAKAHNLAVVPCVVPGPTGMVAMEPPGALSSISTGRGRSRDRAGIGGRRTALGGWPGQDGKYLLICHPIEEHHKAITN